MKSYNKLRRTPFFRLIIVTNWIAGAFSFILALCLAFYTLRPTDGGEGGWNFILVPLDIFAILLATSLLWFSRKATLAKDVNELSSALIFQTLIYAFSVKEVYAGAKSGPYVVYPLLVLQAMLIVANVYFMIQIQRQNTK